MSFLPPGQENQQAPTGQTTNQPTGQPPPMTGGSAGAGSTGGSAKGSSAGSPTQFGSSASKLGDYLSANAPQITNQANTLAGNLNTQYGQVSGDITGAANQFGQQVQGGYAANNPDTVNKALANPSGFASNAQNVKDFQGQYNNAYTGPQSFEGTTPYSNIQNEVGQAVQQGQLLGSQAGLQSYLQGQGNNPTRASSTLDALLMGGNPEAQQTINTAAGQFGNLTGQLGTATAGADQSVLDAQKAAQASQDYARAQSGQAANTFNTGLQNAAQQAEQGRQAFNTGLSAEQSAANTGRQGLMNAQQAALQNLTQYNTSHGGGNLQSVQNLYNPNTSNYDTILGEKMANTPATVANTATTGQYGDAGALAQLLGGNYTSPLDQSMIGQAGSYQAPANGLPLAQANTNAQGQQNYMNDLSSFFTDPSQGGANQNAIGHNGMTPAQAAQADLAGISSGMSGASNAPNWSDLLNRLAANQYG